jgi:hypothetical protein
MPNTGIEHSIVSSLRYAHGFYNTLVILLFLHQGSLGLSIRRERRKGSPTAVRSIKRHRRFGPVFACVGITGFLFGLIVVYLDEGHLFEHQLHFIVGLTIGCLITATFLISKRIRAQSEEWRDLHFIFGILIICLYFVQAFLGIGILF